MLALLRLLKDVTDSNLKFGAERDRGDEVSNWKQNVYACTLPPYLSFSEYLVD